MHAFSQTSDSVKTQSCSNPQLILPYLPETMLRLKRKVMVVSQMPKSVSVQAYNSGEQQRTTQL